MIQRHSQKIADLHKFLTETFETLVSVVEHRPPDFYSGHDYVKLAEAVAVRVRRFGCTVKIVEPATPIEALRLIGKLLGWCQDIIDRERLRVAPIALEEFVRRK